MEEKCSEIETLIKTGSRDEAYRMVKTFFGQHKPRAEGVEDNNVRMLYEHKDIAKRWKDYLEILYKGETLKENETNEENKSEEDDEKDLVMREEFNKALQNLKKKKAVGKLYLHQKTLV